MLDKKILKKAAALTLVVLSLGGSGCMYAGIATAPDGTVYVARNDIFLLGLLRKMYACKPAGASTSCVEVMAP